MKIGIIGPLDSGLKIKNYLEEIRDNIETKLYIGERVIDTIELIASCEEECDAIIFTGCGVAAAVKEKYDVKKVNSFVSRGGTSILKAFNAVRDANLSLNRMSIDVVEKEILDDILKELDMNSNEVFSLPFSEKIDEMEYAKWHINLYKNNKIDVILTGFGGVYKKLKEEGYPVFRLEATRPQIKVCYEKIKEKYELDKAKSYQIAVEIIRLEDCKGCNESYYSNMLKKTDMDKLIIEYVKSIQGALFNFGRDEYIVFAHKGAVEDEANYSRLYKLKKDIKSMGISFKVGIGVGHTAYEGETNAYKAISKSLKSDEFEIYVVDEDNIIKGPLGLENEISYSLVSSDKKIIDISQKTGLSCESVAKIIAISDSRGSYVYDSKELADHLDLSERSARRILKKITEAELGRVYAKETSQGGGRPKNLIEILF